MVQGAQTDVFTAANVVQSERCCYDVVAAFRPQPLDGRRRLHKLCIWPVSNCVRQRACYRAAVRRRWVTQFTVRTARWTYDTAFWCKMITRAQTNVTQFTLRTARWTYDTAFWCKVITRAQTNVFTAANVV